MFAICFVRYIIFVYTVCTWVECIFVNVIFFSQCLNMNVSILQFCFRTSLLWLLQYYNFFNLLLDNDLWLDYHMWIGHVNSIPDECRKKSCYCIWAPALPPEEPWSWLSPVPTVALCAWGANRFAWWCRLCNNGEISAKFPAFCAQAFHHWWLRMPLKSCTVSLRLPLQVSRTGAVWRHWFICSNSWWTWGLGFQWTMVLDSGFKVNNERF